MKVAFIGCVTFSERMLQSLLRVSEANICCVVTRKTSQFNNDFKDLSPLASEHGIPVYYAEGNSQVGIAEFIGRYSPDVIYCFGWSYLLKAEVLRLSRLGVVGFHPAALPSNRGRHPLIWALVLGLDSTAATFFWMDEGADSGDILSQEPVLISSEDNATSLYERVSEIASKQVMTFTKQLAAGNVVRMKQDSTRANYWRKRGRADGKIDFRMTSEAIYNLVRALTRPYVGAHIEYKSTDIKVWDVALASGTFPRNVEPGLILSISGTRILVKTYDSAIEIVDHEFTTMPSVGDYL